MSTVLEPVARPDSFVIPPFPVRRFTVAEYRTLVESGALDEDDRIELLEGWIVPKVPHNPTHDGTVTEVAQRLAQLLPSEWVLRVQCAINTQDSEPEPDHAVVRGPNRLYFRRHPTGSDIGLVIEVAESSLAKDRRKAAMYAADGIPIYWIINLVDRQIEIFTDPETAGRVYRNQRTVKPGTSIDLTLDGNIIGQFPVEELLPPTSP